ncbi:MAG TPA: hypothetical protein VJC03_07930, partial [bacterium]|nr:hypothetical protein [bacterium]
CPYCNSELAFIREYNRYYCYSCRRYAPESGAGPAPAKTIPTPAAPAAPAAPVEGKKTAGAVDFHVLEELRELTKSPEKKDYHAEGKKQEAAEEKTPKPATGSSPAQGEENSPKKNLRKIAVALFFPQGKEKFRDAVQEEMDKTIEKHKLHFSLDYQFTQDYIPNSKVNYAMFAELCRTNQLNVCIVVGPSPEAELEEDEFQNRLRPLLEDEGICLEFISYKDLKQRYNYLNILLDIANFGHQKLGLKTLKELW